MAGIVNSVLSPKAQGLANANGVVPTGAGTGQAAAGVYHTQGQGAVEAANKLAQNQQRAAAGDTQAQDALNSQNPAAVSAAYTAYQGMNAQQRAQYASANPGVFGQFVDKGMVTANEVNDLLGGNGDAQDSTWTSASGQGASTGAYTAPTGPSMANAVVAGAQPGTQPAATSTPTGDLTNPTQGQPPAAATPAATDASGNPATTNPDGTTTKPAPGAPATPGANANTPNTATQPATQPGVVNSGITTTDSTTGATTTTADPNAAVTATTPAAPVDQNIAPVTGTVSTDSTVQGQLNSLLSTGNPLLDAARARAMQTANQRGLQNSSMAAQGGEEAVLSQALPIAGADAATYAAQATTNQNAANQFALSKLSTQEDLDKAYQAFVQSNYIDDKDNALKAYISDSSLSMQDKIAAMQDATAQKSIDERLQEAGLNITANASAAALTWTHQQATNLLNLQQTDFQNYTSAVNIITSSALEPDQKTVAMQNLNNMYAGSAMPDGFDTLLLTTPVGAPTASPPPATTTTG